jgi:hypothetical protein
MCHGRHSNDAYIRCHPAGLEIGDGFLQCGQEQLREQEMADVVGAELNLKAILSLDGRVSHCSRIENEDIESVAIGLELGCRRADGFEGA